MANRDTTVKKLQAVLKSVENGASAAKACKAADLAIVTFYRWLNEDEKNRDLYLEIKDTNVHIVENALFVNAVKNMNVTAQIFFLKNRAPNRWKDRVDTEINFKDVSENREERDKEIASYVDMLQGSLN